MNAVLFCFGSALRRTNLQTFQHYSLWTLRALFQARAGTGVEPSYPLASWCTKPNMTFREWNIIFNNYCYITIVKELYVKYITISAFCLYTPPFIAR